jgi:GT2 family glycosyltransferase
VLSVSVVVCAYTMRRWQELVAAVASVQRQSVRATEIIVVADHNPELAGLAKAEFAGRLCPVRVAENRHERGLSGARNTALEETGADVVAFLDDDAVAHRHWLERLLACYDSPDVLAVGGAAWPIWPSQRRPAPLPPALGWVVGCSFSGQAPGDGRRAERAEVRNLMGCNMSFRQSVFEAVGGFSEGIGRLADTPLGCEETELCIRLRQQRPGARIVFERSATIWHRVGPERVTWRYLRRRCWAEGMSKAFIGTVVGAADGLASERGYVARILPAAMAAEVRSAWRAVFGLDLAALRRGAGGVVAVPFALAVTALGYLRGRANLRNRARRHRGAGPLAPTRRTAEPRTARRRERGQRPATFSFSTERGVAAALTAVGVLACCLAAADVGGGVRLAATMVFLLLGPGWAVAGFLRRASPPLRWLLSIATGISLSILVGQAMVLLGIWYPVGALYLVTAVFAPLLVRHAAGRRPVSGTVEGRT